MIGPTSGNFFIFGSFSGKTEISDNVRYITVLILSAIGFLGPLMMVFFNQSALEDNSGEKHDAEESNSLIQSEKHENTEESTVSLIGVYHIRRKHLSKFSKIFSSRLRKLPLF